MPPSRKPGMSSRTTMLLLIVVLSCLAALITLLSPETVPSYENLPAGALSSGKTVVEIGSTWVVADVAATEAARAKGLSGRASLGKNEGLLFIHPMSGQHSYWMKDMRFPIDIIWVDAERRIVGISPNISPDTYPESFAPKTPVLYVLEVPAGFALAHNIVIGSSIAF
jgi:uncharacterized membrane protein (UPF0127 family)